MCFEETWDECSNTKKVWGSSPVTLTEFKPGDQKMSLDIKRMWIFCETVTVGCPVVLPFLFKVKHKWHIITECEHAAFEGAYLHSYILHGLFFCLNIHNTRACWTVWPQTGVKLWHFLTSQPGWPSQDYDFLSSSSRRGARPPPGSRSHLRSALRLGLLGKNAVPGNLPPERRPN